MPIATVKRRILGVGPAQGALIEFKQLCIDYHVRMIERGPRDRVQADFKRMCEEEGPFEAAFILFANGTYGPMDQDLLGCLWQNGNNVACFAQCGAGYDNVHVPVFTENNCYFTNTPDAVTSSTADFTVLLLLSALRGSTYCERVAASGLWHKGLELTTDPEGLTLGVFGMGRIGKDFARKMKAFGMNIIYNTRTRLPAEDEARLSVTYATKEQLVSTADVICCLCPGTKETYHLLDQKEFDAMKDGVFIINSSRGSVINTTALIGALQNGKVKRAGLDVVEGEPKIPQELLDDPRVTMTPRTIIRGEQAAFANVRAFLEKGSPVSPVNGPF